MKKRNLNIIEERLSGISIDKLAEKYALSKVSIRNIIKKQMKKIAEYESGYEAKLGGYVDVVTGLEGCITDFSQCLDDYREELNILTDQIRLNDKELKKLNATVKNLKSEKSLLNSTVQGLRSERPLLIEKVKILENSLRRGGSLSQAKEYMAARDSFNKFRN